MFNRAATKPLNININSVDPLPFNLFLLVSQLLIFL